ncbi:hypothetical protein GYB60_00435, partial [bacterium]|nr:hypothetical protein [bacterium]
MTKNRTANVGAGAAGMRYLAAFAGGDNALIDTLKRPDLERRRLATIGAAMHIP